MKLHPTLLDWARDHHGLVTLDRWCAFGGSRSSYYRLACAGFLLPLGPGVAALAGQPIGPYQRITAAVLGLGPGLVTSYSTGAFVWGADVEGDDPVELIATGRRARTTRPGVVIHRPDDRHRVRHVMRGGIPVTAPCRTLLDLGASRPGAVSGAVEHFVRSGHTTVPAIRAALERARRSGRNGVAPLAAALEELRTVTDSELETVMRRIFREVGIGGWVFHDRVEGFEVDFCFRCERLIVEVDGWAAHAAEPRRWNRGLERDLVLAAAGWVVVHVTWTMVTRRPEPSIARIRATLEARRDLGRRRAG